MTKAEENLDGYDYAIPQVPEDADFEERFQPELVDNVDRLTEITKGVENSVIAYDCETYTLNPEDEDPVVGFSFSFSAYDGYYVPIRHREDPNGRNVDPEAAKAVLEPFLHRNRVLMYNAAFDLMMLMAEGIDWRKIKTVDVQALVYLADTNWKRNGLKFASARLLGRSRPDFKETIKGAETFADISPEDATYYACADTADTYGVFEVLRAGIQRECPGALKIDLAMAKVLPHILSSQVSIDAPAMREMLAEIEQEIFDCETRCFEATKYPFNMDCLVGTQKVMGGDGKPVEIGKLWAEYLMSGELPKVRTPWGRHRVGAFTTKRVTGYYRVTLSDGTVVECTGGHRFFVQTGDSPETVCWKRADELTETDRVIHSGDSQILRLKKDKKQTIPR